MFEVMQKIILADHDGRLGKNWLNAPKKAQLLLLCFAEFGIQKSLEMAIKRNPLTIDDSFKKHLTRLLAYKC